MILTDILPLERPLIGLDLETTGRNPKKSGIVEIGLEIMRVDGKVTEWRTLVNPIMPIPPGAEAVHHISNDAVRACQTCGMERENTQHLPECPDDAGAHDYKPWPTFVQLATNLARGLSGCDFVGYNVRFDLRQLTEEFARAGIAWDYEGARIIDGLRLWQVMDPRSLEDYIRYWITGEARVPMDAVRATNPGGTLPEFDGQAHNALWDVKMTTRGIAHQLQACPTLPRNVQQLHDLIWPEWFDAEGKLKWNDGELCFSFGEHRDVPIRRAPRGYLEWIIKKDFSELVKQTCAGALRGVLPPAPIVKGPTDEEAAAV